MISQHFNCLQTFRNKHHKYRLLLLLLSVGPCIKRAVNQFEGNSSFQQCFKLCWWDYCFVNIWITEPLRSFDRVYVLVNIWSFCGIWYKDNHKLGAEHWQNLWKYFSHSEVPIGQGAWCCILSLAWLVLFSQLVRKRAAVLSRFVIPP